MNRCALILLSGSALLAGGCATVPTNPDAKAEYIRANDPLEPLNRKIFAFNQFADRNLIKPVAKDYVRLLPQAVRDSIRNFVSNLGEPLVCANNLLQWQLRRAATTTGRFALNTTLGLAGLFDFAQSEGLKKQTGDLGQTFYRWGLPEGPYLMLPILGPSNPRDAVGLVAQGYLDPYRYVVDNNDVSFGVAYSPAILGGIDKRARSIDTLDAVQRESIDFYASLRSLFRQDRSAQLRGNADSPTPGLNDLYDDPGGPGPAKPPPTGSPVTR